MFFLGGMIQLLDGFWGDSTFEGFGWIFDRFPLKKIPGFGFRHTSLFVGGGGGGGGTGGG